MKFFRRSVSEFCQRRNDKLRLGPTAQNTEITGGIVRIIVNNIPTAFEISPQKVESHLDWEAFAKNPTNSVTIFSAFFAK
jgi:hypothetical protein